MVLPAALLHKPRCLCLIPFSGSWRRFSTNKLLPSPSSQTDDSAGDRPDSAYLEFSQPNKFKLLSRVQGLLVGTVVCDGRSVLQWNDTLSMKQAAPLAFQDIHCVLPVGNSALAAEELFAKPNGIEKITDWVDEGPRSDSPRGGSQSLCGR